MTKSVKRSAMMFSLLSPFAVAAHAQSSVTLYGLIDEGVEVASNVATSGGHGGRLYRLDSSNGLNSSRWGLMGKEDLGGGLSTIFRLENGFDLNTGKLGQGGAEFGRQAWVGLSSNRYGTITLGRQYDSVIDYVGHFEFADSNVATDHLAHAADVDNFNNSRRTNNAVKYKSADYGGFTFGGLYSFGGVTGSVARNQEYSLGAAYAQGPLSVGVAYLNVRNPAASIFSNNPSDTATSNGLTSSPVYSGYASANTYQVIGAGGTYEIGRAVLGATYSHVTFGNIVALNGNEAVFNNVEASLLYHLTPTLDAGVGYNYTRASKVSGAVGGANYHELGGGANYKLSRRTDVYVAAVYEIASGNDSTGLRAVANLTGNTPSASSRQAVGRVGLRHRF